MPPLPPPSRTEPADPATCPLCKQPNGCAMEAARLSGEAPQACWCTEIDFSADLLASVPPAAQRLACICAACARRGGAA